MTRARADAEDAHRREGDRSRKREALHLCESLAGAPWGIAVVSARGKVLAANRAFARLLGCAPEAAQGRSVLEGDDGRLRELLTLARRGDPGAIDGPAFANSSASWRLRAESLASGSVLLALEDRTEINIATSAFHASERRFDLLVDSSADGIVLHRDESVLYANPAAVRMLGGRDLADLLGRGLSEFVEASAVASFRRWLGTGTTRRRAGAAAPAPVEHRLRRIDGRTFDAEATQAEATVDDGPAQFVFVRDVTDRRRLEEELERAHRFSSLGTLAGSVAHDFNNLLAGIQGSISLVERHLETPEAAKRALDTARAAADQAGSLARELLTFSRGQKAEPVRVQVFEVIREVTGLFANMGGKEVELSVAVSDETVAAWVARSQLHQVLLNILLNGRDAVDEGGKIHVSLRRSGPAEQWIELTVLDDGPGMDAATRERLFEPFFTTKGPGQGTGLGLSTVYGIVKQAGGWIEVESEPGKGAAFRVFLPSGDRERAQAPQAAQALRTMLAPDATTTAGPAAGSPLAAVPHEPAAHLGHVIVCDDDARLCKLTVALLESSGYRADAHTDANALLGGELGGAQVVLLDLHLGSQDILPVLDALSTRGRPAVVITSGSSPEDVADAIRNHPLVVDYLMKPYRAERLTACLLNAVSDPARDGQPLSSGRQAHRTVLGGEADRSSESGTRQAYSTQIRERALRGTGGGNGDGGRGSR